MLEINENKSSKEKRNLFQSEAQLIIGFYQEKEGNTYKNKIYLLFITGIILFSITINLYLKYKNYKIKDTIISFDYYNGNKDVRKLELNFERNKSRINRYKNKDIILNLFLFLDSYYFLYYFDNVLIYKESSQPKCNYNIHDKISNINKTENCNNYEMYEETKIVSFFKNILYETITEQYFLSLTFDISIIIIIVKIIFYNNIREEKRREEKRNCNQGGAPRIKMDLNENGFNEVEKESRKTSNINGKTKKINDNIRIANNSKNKRKNKILRNIIHVRNNIIIIKLLIIIKLFIQILPYNKNNWINIQFSNITLKIKGTGNKNVFSNISDFTKDYYPNFVYINGNKQETVNHSYYLNQTDNVIELIWNNTIDNCKNIFSRCSDIIEIDLSDFDTSECTFMFDMFSYCPSITSLNLSNFNTSKVTNMQGMFINCSPLTSLNLSNFNTTDVKTMYAMFRFCSSLTSLDLSNFNTSQVTNMQQMFNGCINLEYINLQNFEESQFARYSSYNLMFTNVPDNVVICINIEKTNNKILPHIINQRQCYSINCTNNWKSIQKKIIIDNGTCIDNCQNSPHYKYEYNKKCFENCSYGYILDSNDNNTYQCKCELEKCLTSSTVSLHFGLCTKCNINYYKKENDPSNIGEYINCYKEISGYYLDKNESLFKKCYDTCETCEIKGNNITHNCLTCNVNNPIIIKINNYSNCYENCSYYYFFDNENYYHCTINFTCPNEYPVLVQDTNECRQKFINQYETQKLIDEIFKNITKEESIEKNDFYDIIIYTIENIFTSENYNKSNLDNGNDEKIRAENMTFIFSTTHNQKSNINDNMTRIDIGYCEVLLRNYYNLTNNETLYMKIIEIEQKEMKIPKIEYDIYNKILGNKLEKINKSICENTKVNIYIPIIITGNIDKANSSSGYYNDICYTTTSDSGTDITIKDRRKEIGIQTACQDDCDFADYNYTTLKANCSCDVKESSLSFADMTINKEKLLKNFKNIKNFINFNILICYRKLFNSKGIFKNIGSLIIIVLILFHIITFFIFYIKQLGIIVNKIKDIIFSIKRFGLLKKAKKEKKQVLNNDIINKENKNDNIKNNTKLPTKCRKKRKSFKKKKRNLSNNNQIPINKNIEVNEIIENKKKIILNSRLNNKKIKKLFKKDIDSDRQNIININKNDNKIIVNNNYNNNINNKNLTMKKENIISKVKRILEYNDDEINTLEYDLALEYDKRTFSQYYISLLRTKHNFIFSFCNNDDYNSKIIKMDLFFIGFSINYTVNALFFDDDTMKKIYKSNGSFDLEVQIPMAIYSSLISMILNLLLKLFALSNDNIIDFKKNKEKKDVNQRGNNLNFEIKLKSILFFITSFFFLLFFWYYISIFGVIYKNTQLHLLKDTLISFGISMLTPFALYLLPGLCRIPSLSNPKEKKECLYKFSQILQML